MKQQRITIEITSVGAISADAEGFSGDTCIKELEKLLEGLASAPLMVDRKPTTSGAQIVCKQQNSSKNAGKGRP
ncbi:MAG: hypothetical protein WC712_03280 [Candidatus Brocadiia bacterium]